MKEISRHNWKQILVDESDNTQGEVAQRGSGTAIAEKAKSAFEGSPALSLDNVTSKGPNLIKFSCDFMTELDSSVILKNWEEALSEASTDMQSLPEKVLS